jgi:hypothetical protein
MMNSLLCAVGSHAKYGTDEEMKTARTLLGEMPRMVLGEEGVKRGVTKAPNAIEEYHDLGEVRPKISRG